MPTRKVTEAKDLYLLRYSKKKFVLARNIGVMYHAILLGMRPFMSFKHFLNPYQGVYKHVNETFPLNYHWPNASDFANIGTSASKDLVSAWTLDEGFDSRVQDASDNEHNGVISGA